MWHKNLRSNNTFRCEYIFYCDLTLANILDCECTNLPCYCTKLSIFKVFGWICTLLSSYYTKLSTLQVVGSICTHLTSCCMMVQFTLIKNFLTNLRTIPSRRSELGESYHRLPISQSPAPCWLQCNSHPGLVSGLGRSLALFSAEREVGSIMYYRFFFCFLVTAGPTAGAKRAV